VSLVLDGVLFLSVFFSQPVLKGCQFSSLLFDINVFNDLKHLVHFFGSINNLMGQTFVAIECS